MDVALTSQMITVVNANHGLLERRVKVNLDSSNMEEWFVIFYLPALLLLIFLMLLLVPLPLLLNEESHVLLSCSGNLQRYTTASTAHAKTMEAVTTYLMLIGAIVNQDSMGRSVKVNNFTQILKTKASSRRKFPLKANFSSSLQR